MIINYFPHDSNARSDNKIIALRMKYGWEGYGLFWAIVEKLRDSTDYRLAADYDAIAYDLRTDTAVVRSIILDFGLFEVNAEGNFYSLSLMRRMEIKDERSAKSREAAQARWRKERSERSAELMPEQCDGIALVEPEKQSRTEKRKGKSVCGQIRSEIERIVFEVLLCDRKLVTAREETERLLAFYDSRGWQSGRAPITDAGAVARLWEPRQHPEPLPPRAGITLCALYQVFSQQPGFSWRQFCVFGGRYDAEIDKLLLSCPKAFGVVALSLRAEIQEAVCMAGGVGFRLVYNDEK